MKRLYAIFIVLLPLFGPVMAQDNSQPVMTVDEMEMFAEQLNELVLAERFEEAVLLYDDNRDIVNPKALCRQDRAWWKETVTDLEAKLALFNGNRDRIMEAQSLYNALEYRRCYDIVEGLNCDTTNVYRQFTFVLSALRDSLEDKRMAMRDIDQAMPGYIADFRSGRYGGLYCLLDNENLIGCVAEAQRTVVREMVDSLNARLARDPIAVVMGGTSLSLRQLRSICNGDVSRLLFLLQLDVVHYYNMLFDTEQQIARYRESAEYAEKLAELQTMRNKALQTLYCQEEVVNTGVYDAEHGCFNVLIGSNRGVNLPYFNYKTADPPKGFGKRFEKVVHEALHITLSSDPSLAVKYKNGDRFIQHYLSVPVPALVAKQYENQNCRLVICFVPSGLRQYSFEGAELQTANHAYDIFTVCQEFPYSTSCRVMLVAEDGKVVYDEIVR